MEYIADALANEFITVNELILVSVPGGDVRVVVPSDGSISINTKKNSLAGDYAVEFKLISLRSAHDWFESDPVTLNVKIIACLYEVSLPAVENYY